MISWNRINFGEENLAEELRRDIQEIEKDRGGPRLPPRLEKERRTPPRGCPTLRRSLSATDSHPHSPFRKAASGTSAESANIIPFLNAGFHLGAPIAT